MCHSVVIEDKMKVESVGDDSCKYEGLLEQNF